jgi:SAM-dependent methyltransferase
MSVTGERVVTDRGGFNPAWQRHVAAYAFCATVLGPGRVVDVGCGVGHSYRLLAPRETVGVDVAAAALAGQERETAVADMRDMPFPDRSFEGAVSVHSIEHVPDPWRVLAEVSRVLAPGATAVFVTPNRLTFGRPDEIIDPYHYIEFDPAELRALCRPYFMRVDLLGVFGSDRVQAINARERLKLDALLRKDPLRLRRLMPRAVRQRLYDWRLTRERLGEDPDAEAVRPEDFAVREGPLEQAIDLVAVCSGPGRWA